MKVNLFGMKENVIKSQSNIQIIEKLNIYLKVTKTYMILQKKR